MSTTPTITAADPRVAQILALIRAKAGAATPPDTATAPLDASIPQQPMQNASVAPQPQLQAPAPMPARVNELGAPLQPTNELGAALPMSQQAPVAAPPPQAGPVKSFLQHLVSGLGQTAYAGTQGALQRLGIPTDYEKQQDALKIGLQQQQQNSLEGLRTAQTSAAQAKADQLDAMNQPFQVPDDPSIPAALRGQTITQGAWQGLSKVFGQNQGKMDVQSEKDKALLERAQVLVDNAGKSFKSVPGTVGGQPAFANYSPKTGQYTDQAGNVLADFKPASKAMQGSLGSFGPAFAATRTLMAAYNENPALLPVLAPMLAKLLAPGDPNAEKIFASVPNGQPQDAAGNALGLRMPGSPTGATRTRGQFAEQVGATMQAALKEIGANSDQLGPFMGRISDLYTSKVGAYGPQYSALQTDLHNIATGWGRLHGNSVETMKQFNDDLNTAKDPANLIAKLQRYKEQADIYSKGGQGVPISPSTGIQSLTDGGTTYHIPAALVSAFKKDHPNAR